MFLNTLINTLNGYVQPKRTIKPKKSISEQDTMTDRVFDNKHVEQNLNSRLAKGGEGEIYPLRDRPLILIKKYHPDILKQSKTELSEKIEAMRGLRAQFKNHKMSWPAISVYDQQKQWIGYAMPKIEGHTMRVLAHAIAYKKYAPNLNRQNIVNVLIHFLENIRHLHQHKIMIGDYNLSNFMWNPKDFSVGLIDCDSYQIYCNNKIFPCLVGSPDLTAPEHQNIPFKDVVRTEASEYFSISIVLFMCLMLGRHPYDMLDGEDPVKNLQSGKFAYGKGNSGIPKGQWYNIWSHMPYKIKTLFIQSFTEGVKQPEKRVTIETWLAHLRIYERDLNKGYHAIEIIPAAPKNPVKHSSTA